MTTVAAQAAPGTTGGDGPAGQAGTHAIEFDSVTASYGAVVAVRNVTVPIDSRRITAIIGPSGCGKSTLLRCINRLHETQPGARISGTLRVAGEDVYGPDVDPTDLRRRVGMVFQKPNPFPNMSIFDNVAAGLRLARLFVPRSRVRDRVEQALRQAALWDEVADHLKAPAVDLSGGQQQRLCIARALAVDPDILLLDEPCSALDPIATLRIEELLVDLAKLLTVVLVTHNMQQAARIADETIVLIAGEDRVGELVEHGPSDTIFTAPRDRRTEDYVTGRYG